MSLFQLTGFQRDLLTIIAGMEQPTGQEVKDEYEHTTGIRITHGRLYPNLDTLVEENLIYKGALSGRTNYYELTETGETALVSRTDWRETHLSDL